MGTTSQKLSYLNETKGKLKDSINKFKNGITNQTTFRNYVTELDGVYDLLPKIDNTDEELELLNVQNGKLDEFKMYGNTQQNNLDSNNLFDGALELGGLNYDTGQNVENNNTCRSKNYIPIGSVTKFNIIVKEAYETNQTMAFRFYDKDYNYIGRESAVNVTNTKEIIVNNSLDISKTVAYMRFSVTTSNDLTKDFCVRTDNNTEYEPPSPNPSYPQPVKVVTGDNTIKVTGKNLCNNNYLNIALNFQTNEIISSTNSRTTYAKVPKNTNITISKTDVTNRFRVGLLNKIPEVQDTFYLAYINDDSSTLTTTINTGNYEYVAVQYTSQSQDTNLMIEKGSTPTPYQPYQEQTYPLNLGNYELCKIENYQDYIYKDNDKWYKKSYIGTKLLNGDESWGYANGVFYNTDITTLIGEGTNALSKYFIGASSQDNTTGVNTNNPNNSICLAKSGSGRIYIKTNIASSSNDFKTWLSTHNTIVYYVLATPTDTQITDTTLINQLEAISVFTGTNYFTISNLNNVLPNIYLKRLKQLDKLS